ncbi:nucleotidyltransferase family protein [Collinsella tanakaei]|uniref:nucleotidyltransferase family protein n=1 Tax=Collinsella tanakaei TaxID=626935 RepID=UPI0025A40D3B|nr:nucleotidyltransferase domain-containing protein [Collinsella tanakaei]MDM8301436.1 nucleotidyltransferase domain-containing protein [Collinsella tanakaei]
MLQIADIQDAVRRTAQEYGLTRVVLFGSFARGEADDSSDIDLVIETSRPLGFARGAIYNELERELGRPVDIVFGASNLYPFVREAYEREGITLYEA